MPNFSQDIQNFQRYGTYTYLYDSVGNMTFDSSSVNFNQVYVAFPLQNIVYDNAKIKTMYNVEFEEFVPQTNAISETETLTDLQDQLVTVQQENDALKEQLNTIIDQVSNNSADVNLVAVKQVILELRKAVGQGRVTSDFSDTFPYTPIRKDNV